MKIHELIKRGPDMVQYNITLKDFEDISRELIKNETGLELGENLYTSVDDETGFVRIIIDEDEITEEENELLFEKGFDTQEWYLMTEAILAKIFGSFRAQAYVDLDYWESKFPIVIPYEDYKKKLSENSL